MKACATARRGQETQIISNIASTTRTTGGYSTRQSNLSTSGGGAVYGCRSAAGGSAATPSPQNPCIRANNLSTGYAFEFNASDGAVVGLISAGAGGDAKKPFVTNATGVATGLNADRVDGLDAAQIVAAARVKTGLDADTLDGKDLTDVQARFAQVTVDGDRDADARLCRPTAYRHPAGAGTYDRRLQRRSDDCALAATITGDDAGQITATPTVAGEQADDDRVDVRTFDGDGVALNRAFHLSANC